MNVSLTPELERYVKAKVKTGYYNNASEVVREALREMILLDSAQQNGKRISLGLAETSVAYQPEKQARPSKEKRKSSISRADADARALGRLRAAIQKGVDSPDDEDFSFDKLRASLTGKRRPRAK